MKADFRASYQRTGRTRITHARARLTTVSSNW